jgi:hypothetical protein
MTQSVFGTRRCTHKALLTNCNSFHSSATSCDGLRNIPDGPRMAHCRCAQFASCSGCVFALSVLYESGLFRWTQQHFRTEQIPAPHSQESYAFFELETAAWCSRVPSAMNEDSRLSVLGACLGAGPEWRDGDSRRAQGVRPQ